MCLILTIIATFPLKRLFILCCNLLLSYLFFTLLGKPNKVKDGDLHIHCSIYVLPLLPSLLQYTTEESCRERNWDSTGQIRFLGLFPHSAQCTGTNREEGNKSQCWWSFIRLDYYTTEKWPSSDPKLHPLLKCPCSSLQWRAQREPSHASLLENCSYGNRMPGQWIFPQSHHGTSLTLISLRPY